MIQFGCVARYFNPYDEEVNFARENGFTFLQVWYDRNGLLTQEITAQLQVMKSCPYPAILHALLDVNEIEEHTQKLLNIAEILEHKEVILHPVCKSEAITEQSIYKLAEKVAEALLAFKSRGITLYLENNSKLDPIFTSEEELKIMFDRNPDLEFLLDIAHIDDERHLQRMLEIRMPKILHIADRHLEVVHEHLPIGKGNINYKGIINDNFKGFEGRIILEITQSNEEIIHSKKRIEEFFTAAGQA